jgi:hypothetical protein
MVDRWVETAGLANVGYCTVLDAPYEADDVITSSEQVER